MLDPRGPSIPDPEVLYEVSGRVALITLNRPRDCNAQSWTLLDALAATFATPPPTFNDKLIPGPAGEIEVEEREPSTQGFGHRLHPRRGDRAAE